MAAERASVRNQVPTEVLSMPDNPKFWGYSLPRHLVRIVVLPGWSICHIDGAAHYVDAGAARAAHWWES
jgi:hypothetical protein